MLQRANVLLVYAKRLFAFVALTTSWREAEKGRKKVAARKNGKITVAVAY